MPTHWAVLIIGILLVVWGLPAAHRLRYPLDIAAAVTVVAGVVLGYTGALLLVVPDFFKG